MITHVVLYMQPLLVSLSIAIDIDRGAKSSDLLVSQLWQILGGHKKTAALHTLVPADYLHADPVFVDIRMLLHNLGLLQVRRVNLKNYFPHNSFRKMFIDF